ADNPPFGGGLKAVRNPLVSSLGANLGRAAFPYIKTPPLIEVGYGMAVYNPLLQAERILRRAVGEALESAASARRGEGLVGREKLQDLILRERVVTAYQAIMELKDRTVLGFEALSRGA